MCDPHACQYTMSILLVRLFCWYSEGRVPHVQAHSQDERQDRRAYLRAPRLRLLPPGSGELQDLRVPYGPGSRLLAQGSSEADTCPVGGLTRP
jgi:hypothetical protein